MSVGQSWVAAGKISLPALVIGLHGLVLAVAALGLAARHHRWNIKDLWQRTEANA